MTAEVFRSIDETLLLLSEARERAERAVAEARAAGAQPHLVAALAAADQDLLALHRRVLEASLSQTGSTERQLELDAA